MKQQQQQQHTETTNNIRCKLCYLNQSQILVYFYAFTAIVLIAQKTLVSDSLNEIIKIFTSNQWFFVSRHRQGKYRKKFRFEHELNLIWFSHAVFAVNLTNSFVSIKLHTTYCPTKNDSDWVYTHEINVTCWHSKSEKLTNKSEIEVVWFCVVLLFHRTIK